MEVGLTLCCLFLLEIVGGKSALFAALNVGLGGTGSLNERGRNLKEYIRNQQRLVEICERKVVRL